MTVLDRWNASFNHEEPEYVSSFVQVIMKQKQMEIDAQYGDQLTEDDFCFTPFKDFTLQKWCGFEASWGVSVPYKVFHPDVAPTRYLVHDGDDWVHVDAIPAGVDRYRIEAHDGRISEVMGDGRDINFWVDGNLYAGPGGMIDQPEWDAGATMDLWSERLGNRKGELLEEAVYDKVARDFERTIEEHDFLPIFGLHGFAESVRESFGLKAFARFLRKDTQVMAHAVKMHESIALASARAGAKAGIPFFVIADDIAFKHGVFCSPAHYRKFFAPLYKKMADIVHKAGSKIFFHSDGYTEPYWDTWINYCKFDGQESLEPAAWMFPPGFEDDPVLPGTTSRNPDLQKPGKVIRYLKESYGDKFILIGNMDMSTVMPLASPAEVAWVTKDILASGAPGGGFVFACCTDITDATPLENIIAMRESYRKHRGEFQ